jgi:hypothetical protein
MDETKLSDIKSAKDEFLLKLAGLGLTADYVSDMLLEMNRAIEKRLHHFRKEVKLSEALAVNCTSPNRHLSHEDLKGE